MKTLILALGYGAGPRKLAQILSINGHPTDADTAKGYLDDLERLYRVFFQWKRVVIARAHAKGYVTTLGGRHRRLKHAFKEAWNWKQVGYGERQAVNAVVQGSAGDVVRRAMVTIAREMPYASMLAQVHDELVFENDPTLSLEALRQMAEEPAVHYDLQVPLVFEPSVVSDWSQKGGTKLDLEDVSLEEDE